ncbi:trace amine-associated receptor 2 [Biomphalaria glabrata]|nr:trace amine-associated receptor 2 [Biomphalaria glabrata]
MATPDFSTKISEIFTGLSTQTNNATDRGMGLLSASTNSNSTSSPASVISDDIFNIIDIIINCFLVHALSLLGIFGNILNGLVLFRHRFKEPSNIILLSLSVSDFFYSMCVPFRRMRSIITRFSPAYAITFKTFSEVNLFSFSTACMATSLTHVTAIAVERLTAVCFPFHVSRIFTSRRVKLLVLFLYVYNFSLMIPLFMKYTYVWMFHPGYNTTVAQVDLTPWAKGSLGEVTYYESYVMTPLVSLVTLLVILLCSTVIVIKLTIVRDLKRLSSISSSSNAASKNAKVVKMLLTVCVVTLLSCLPTTILDIIEVIANRSMMVTTNSLLLKNSVQVLLYQFNASANFIVYVTMSSKFSKTCRKILRCVCCVFKKKEKAIEPLLK